MPAVNYYSSDGKYRVVIHSDSISIIGNKIIKKFETNYPVHVQFFNNWVYISFRGSSSSPALQNFIDLKSEKCYTSNFSDSWGAIYPNPSGTMFAVDVSLCDVGILKFYDFSNPEQGLREIQQGKISNSYWIELNGYYNIKWLDDTSMEYIKSIKWCKSRNQPEDNIPWKEFSKIPQEDIELRLRYQTIWKFKDRKMRCCEIKSFDNYEELVQDDLKSEADENIYLSQIKRKNSQYRKLRESFEKFRIHTCADDTGLIRSNSLDIEKAHFEAHINRYTVKCFPDKVVVWNFGVWPNTKNVFSSIEDAISSMKI